MDRRIAELVARDTWVMDGNYGRTLSTRLPACDTAVFLDLPAAVCIWRVIRRRLQFAGRARPDLPSDYPERLTWEFVWWIWTYRRRRRPDVLRRPAGVTPEKRVIVLRSVKEVREFLASLPVGGGSG